MKTLKFASNLVALVLSGEKTATWRMFDDKDLAVGDELSLLDQATGKEFAQAKITAVEEKTFGKIDASDLVGHEHYTSRDEMLKVYQSYYGDRVTEDTPVKMIDFELVK
jgi:hypothetical protein